MTALRYLVTLVAFACARGAHAEVVDADGGGFLVRNTATASVDPSKSWALLIQPAKYWNPDHSWSGDAANLALDARAGGCFCEALPASGGSAEHMRVVNATPGQLIRLSGALGPLQSEALFGTLTVTLKPVQGGTEISWEYIVGGHSRFDLTEIAPAVDGVLAEQLGRLVMELDK